MKTAQLDSFKNMSSFKISKITALILTSLLSYIVLSLPTHAIGAEVLKLKTNIEVKKDIVTLGDIFENMSRYQNEAIFKSPALGRQGTVRIERLIEAAERYDFTFETPLNLKKITVSRPARQIKPETVKSFILNKIKQENTHSRYNKASQLKNITTKLNFRTPLNTIMVPLSFSGNLKFKQFKFNQIRRTFEVTIQPTEANGKNFSKTLTGSIKTVALHPVLKRTLKKGDTIDSSDIEFLEFSPNRIPNNTIQSKHQLIGKVASKSLSAGSFIRGTDIEKRKVIKKDQLVTLILEKPGLSLKTQGKAITSASLNETISVMNIQSKRIIHGVVKAPGLVMVQTKIYEKKSLKTAQLN